MSTASNRALSKENQLILDASHSLTRVARLGFEQSDFEQRYQAALRQKAKTSQFTGFRKSHAPLAMVERYHRPAILETAWNSIIKQTIQQYLARIEEELFSPPRLNSKVTGGVEGAPFEFEITYEVYPKIKVNQIAGCRVAIPEPRLTQGDLDESIQQLRYQHAQASPKPEGSAQWGDRVRLRYRSQSDAADQAQEWGSERAILLVKSPWTSTSQEAAQGGPLPFELEGLIGAKAGATLLLKSNLEEETGWQVQILGVDGLCLPELNGSWIKSLGVHPNNVSALRQVLRTQIHMQSQVFRRSYLKNTLIGLLTQTHPNLPIPRSLLLDSLQEIGVSGHTQDAIQDSDLLAEERLPQARNLACQKLLLSYLIQRYRLSVSANKLAALVRQAPLIGLSHEQSTKAEREQQCHQYLLEDEATKLLEGYVEVQEPVSDFSEFLEYAASGKPPASLVELQNSWEEPHGRLDADDRDAQTKAPAPVTEEESIESTDTSGPKPQTPKPKRTNCKSTAGAQTKAGEKGPASEAPDGRSKPMPARKSGPAKKPSSPRKKELSGQPVLAKKIVEE